MLETLALALAALAAAQAALDAAQLEALPEPWLISLHLATRSPFTVTALKVVSNRYSTKSPKHGRSGAAIERY